jgi:hypothetical protein
VVVHKLNLICIPFSPGEADSPLIVDSNAVGTRSIALQQFKLVARRYAQILQPHRPVQEQKIPARRPLDRLKSPNSLVVKEQCRIRALE